MTLLSPELLENIGRQAPPRRELVTRREIRKYAVATGNRQQKYLDGDLAPPMFHVPLFWDVVELDKLSEDGVSIDELLPKFPLNKAMAGGLKTHAHGNLRKRRTIRATHFLRGGNGC
jgi:hypothetical protein